MSDLRKAFRESLRIGIGRAILILQDHLSIDFDDIILEACTHNLAFDPQCEGTRADYLFEILSFVKDRGAIENAIVNRLLYSNNDDWDTYLLFDLAMKLAKCGNNRTREALYKRYIKNLEDDNDFTDTSSTLIELDGLKGMEFVAEVQGKMAENDPEFGCSCWLLKAYEDEFPHSPPRAYLEKKSKTNRHIARYLSEVEKSEQRSVNRCKSTWTYSAISAQINQGKNLAVITGRKLDAEALRRLAVDFENEQDITKQLLYLRVFNTVEYPGNISYIAPFLDSNDERISYPAANIMGRTKNPIVRKIIDEHYSDLDYLEKHLRIFLRNYQPKDLSIFIKIANTLKNDIDIHDFTSHIIDIFQENEIEYPSQLLNHLYQITNCSTCRYKMVNMLIDSDGLSEDIYQELEYDCSSRIRELFKEITE